MDMHTFFAMGGYAAFVWPSYGLALVVMAALLLVSLRGARRRERELERLQQLRRDRPRAARRRGSADPTVPGGPATPAEEGSS